MEDINHLLSLHHLCMSNKSEILTQIIHGHTNAQYGYNHNYHTSGICKYDFLTLMPII